MKLTEHFDAFLAEHVNLNQSRLDSLEARVASVVNYLKGLPPLDTHLARVVRQGSWEHRTIIKPQVGKEFDADIAVLLYRVVGWEPKDYVEQFYGTLRGHGTYRSMVHRRTRCVTLSYAGDFHLDIAPVVVSEMPLGFQFAQNRITNQEERTAPEAYSDWLRNKNLHTQRNMLVKVTRLVKYLRDVKQTFAVPSILLTTLLGAQVDDRPDLGDDSAKWYSDVPSSLVTIFGRLDDALQKSEQIPEVRNPALRDELFSQKWDEPAYANLRDRISLYRQWMDDAYAEEDRLLSIARWRRVFGDEFAAGVDIPSKVIVAAQLPSASHEQKLNWPVLESERVQIDATVYDASRKNCLGGLNSGGRGLAKGLSLKFMARAEARPPFDVVWQVVNTGREARAANQLRGGFYDSEGNMSRWETTRYKGCHWVRCFLLRNGICIAVSERFVVRVR